MTKELLLYQEYEKAGNPYRASYLDETLAFIRREKTRAKQVRAKYFTPDYSSEAAYRGSIRAYRQELAALLGLPYFERFPRPETAAECARVAEDSLARIFRVRIPVLPELFLYGLLFQVSDSPGPLVIVQHGGQGTPELCAGFFGSENYQEIVRRFLRRGAHVFAPQLLLYKADRFGPAYDRNALDITLRQLGTSLAALHVCELQRGLDWLQARPFVRPDRIGMAGLSYGGFYTLIAAAVDPRIRAAYIAGIFNDRFRYGWEDMIMPGQATKLMDAEIAGLICPRPLFIEAGSDDELFDVHGAKREAQRTAHHYEKLRLDGRFEFRAFTGTHEFCPDDKGVDFLLDGLK